MKTLIVLLLIASAAVYAKPKQLLLEQEKASSWRGMVKFAPGSVRGKGPCFLLYGRYPTALAYNKLIRIDPGKTYVYKASFRTVDPKLPASAYLGMDVYDRNKRRIGFCNVQPLYGTDSVVVSAGKGEKFLTIKPFKSKKQYRVFTVAFGAAKDYSDLPNFDLSPRSKGMKTDAGGNLRIELHSPLKKTYPAGTPVRLHSPWNPGMYYLAKGWVPAGNGEERVVQLQSAAVKPGSAKGTFQFWKGTVYIRPFIWFGNWDRIPKKGAELLVDGYSLEELPGKAAAKGK